METKAPNPAERLPAGSAGQWQRFYFEFAHLKNLYRQGWLQHGIPHERCESVAEHSFGVVVLSMLLADAFYRSLRIERVLRLALLHDFGEIYAGDLTPRDGMSSAEKAAQESASVARVFASFPNGEEYLRLWEEYEAGSSPEARLVRQVDRLEMGLQAAVYRQQGFERLEGFFDSTRQALSSPEIIGIFEALE